MSDDRPDLHLWIETHNRVDALEKKLEAAWGWAIVGVCFGILNLGGLVAFLVIR